MEDWKKIFLSSEGRLNRLKYFKLTMILGVVGAILSIGVGGIFGDGPENITDSEKNLCMLISLGLLVPEYFLNVRRVHDFEGNEFLPKLMFGIGFYAIVFTSGDSDDFANLSEYLSDWSMLDYVITALDLYMLFYPGTQGANMYGEDPLQ